MEAQPCRFNNSELGPALIYTIRELAKFIGADPKDVVLVDNATTAVNTVVTSMELKRGDNVLLLSIGYAAVSKTVKHMSLTTGASCNEVVVKIPVNLDKVLKDIESLLNANTKLAIIDHITSGTGLVLPIKQIIDICHAKNVPILIDGAHAIGQVPLNVEELGADFYTSNCHKWLYSSKGSAFLWVNKKYHAKIRPLVISLGYNFGFNSEFLWIGTRDYTTMLSIITALQFYQKLGPEKIRSYMHELAIWAGTELKNSWGTRFIFEETEQFKMNDVVGSLCIVEIPAPAGATDADAFALHDRLWNDFKIEVPVIILDKRLHIRISAQIYNEQSDYLKLAEAINIIYPKAKH